MKYSVLLQEIRKIPKLFEQYHSGMKSFFIDGSSFPLIRIYQSQKDKYVVEIVHELMWSKTYTNRKGKYIRLLDENGRELYYGGNGEYKTYRIDQNLHIRDALDQLKKSILLLPMKEKIQSLEQDFEENEPSGI
jgi:hypothetical protein